MTSKELLHVGRINDKLLLIKHRKENNCPEQKTFKLPPNSVLQQVRSFLPQLAKANVELEERMKADADAVNIEHISDGYNGDIIEMNVALLEHSDGDSGSGTDETDSEDSDADEPLSHLLPITPDNMKIRKTDSNQRTAHIEVISSDEAGGGQLEAAASP